MATEATLDPSLEAEHLTVVMEAGELYLLDQYPNLRTLDLTGSTCYEAILHYMENHPQVEVTYSVDLGVELLFQHLPDLPDTVCQREDLLYRPMPP